VDRQRIRYIIEYMETGDDPVITPSVLSPHLKERTRDKEEETPTAIPGNMLALFVMDD